MTSFHVHFLRSVSYTHLEFDTNHFYLFKSRFYVGASGEIGKWDEERNGRDVDGNYKGYEPVSYTHLTAINQQKITSMN